MKTNNQNDYKLIVSGVDNFYPSDGNKEAGMIKFITALTNNLENIKNNNEMIQEYNNIIEFVRIYAINLKND